MVARAKYFVPPEPLRPSPEDVLIMFEEYIKKLFMRLKQAIRGAIHGR